MRLRVVIADGGVAGVEALLALRALEAGLVELTLVSSDDRFSYRPFAVGQSFALCEARRTPLSCAARDVRARFEDAAVTAVNVAERSVTMTGGDTLGFDALVLAVGARSEPASTMV